MKALYAITISFFILINTVAIAQTQSWQWARSAGGISNDIGTCIGVDATGNIYVAGDFGSRAIAFGNTTLTTVNAQNIFLVKYDPFGNVIWAKSPETRIGSKVVVAGLVTDDRGNVYITGYLTAGYIAFGNDTLGGASAFTVKYDSNGIVIWAKSATSQVSGNIEGTGISVDAKGNVFATGIAQSLNVMFGDTGLSTFGDDPYLVKYDLSGNVTWVQIAGGARVITDALGNVYTTGYDEDFLAKYDSAGDVIWTQNVPGTAVAINIDINSYIYLTGYFNGASVIFGNDTLISSSPDTIGNVFIAKYDSNDNVIWAKNIARSSNDNVTSIIADVDGNIYMTGYFGTPITIFENDTLTNTSTSGFDYFMVKYDSIGNMDWAKSLNGFFSDKQYPNTALPETACASADAKGNVYMTGQFSSPTIILGSDTLINDTTNGTNDFFIAKLGNTTSTGIATLNTPINRITVYPNPSTGNIYFSGVKNGNTLQVYNVLGEIIYTTTIDQDNFKINLSGKAKGMYFYRISDNTVSIQQGKIVLE